MFDPCCLICLCVHVSADFVDHVSGGDVANRLERAPEFEVTAPNKADRLIMTREVSLPPFCV